MKIPETLEAFAALPAIEALNLVAETARGQLAELAGAPASAARPSAQR